MSYEMKYRPFRILKKFEVSGDLDMLRNNYPNAKVARNLNGRPYGWYKMMSVVDIPSEQELDLFLNTPGLAIEIPQDPRGFDERTSGVARSVKSSIEAGEKSKQEISKRKFQKREAEAKTKKKRSKKTKSEPEPNEGSENINSQLTEENTDV